MTHLLTKVEAAKLAGTSTRTIERYASKGLIGVEYVKGRGKPQPRYKAEDVEPLRAQIDMTRGRAAVTPPTTNTIVSLRMPQQYFDLLFQGAEQRRMSP